MTQSTPPDSAPAAANPVDHWRKLPRRTLAIALSILPLVALVNVAVLVYSLGGINLSEKLKEPSLLGLAALLVFVPMFANSVRLALWARFLGVKLGFRKSLKVITGTMVTNSVTPSAAGGMPIKLLFLMGEGVDSKRSVTLLSFQAAEDTFITFAMVGLCLAYTGLAMFSFLGSDPELLARLTDMVRDVSVTVFWSVLAVVALIFVIAGGLLGRRVRAWAGRFSRKIKSHLAHVASDWAAVLARGKWMAIANLGLAALQWMVRFSIAGLILAAFGVEWQAALFWLLQYLVQTISSIVPTPGGVGAAEAAFLLLFAPFVPKVVLFPAMSTWRLMHFYLPLVGAACTFFVLHRRDRAKSKRADNASPDASTDDAIAQPAE